MVQKFKLSAFQPQSIYRNTVSGFSADESSYIAETDTIVFQDKNLEPYKHYFYKVVPVGKSGEVFFASSEVSAETFVPGIKPVVNVSGINAKETVSNALKLLQKTMPTCWPSGILLMSDL